VAILNQPLILEGIADFASLSKNPDDLSELVRRRLGLYFVLNTSAAPVWSGRSRSIPGLEQWLAPKVHRSPSEVGLALDPATARHLLNEINRRTGELVCRRPARRSSWSPTEIRLPLKRFFESSFPRLAVLAFQELPAATEIENAGIITAPAHMLRPMCP
jgi:flagellar biosynthesis protein FlhA